MEGIATSRSASVVPHGNAIDYTRLYDFRKRPQGDSLSLQLSLHKEYIEDLSFLNNQSIR